MTSSSTVLAPSAGPSVVNRFTGQGGEPPRGQYCVPALASALPAKISGGASAPTVSAVCTSKTMVESFGVTLSQARKPHCTICAGGQTAVYTCVYTAEPNPGMSIV